MRVVLRHKGYYGEIYYSEEDEAYIGMVLGFRGVITCHGDSITQTQNELIDSINHYLEVCEDEGWLPNATDPSVALEMEAFFGNNAFGNLLAVSATRVGSYELEEVDLHEYRIR